MSDSLSTDNTVLRDTVGPPGQTSPRARSVRRCSAAKFAMLDDRVRVDLPRRRTRFREFQNHLAEPSDEVPVTLRHLHVVDHRISRRIETADLFLAPCSGSPTGGANGSELELSDMDISLPFNAIGFWARARIKVGAL